MNITPNTWTNWGDATNVVRLIGLVIPLLTALLTKKMAASGLKSVVTLALSVLTGVVVVLVAPNGHGYAFGSFVNAFLNAFLPAIATYYGLWKPTGVAGKVAASTPTFGLGKPILTLPQKGDEAAGSAVVSNAAVSSARGDAGYGLLGTIGAVLAVLGLLLLVLDLLGVFATSLGVCIVLLVMGVVLYMVGSRSSL